MLGTSDTYAYGMPVLCSAIGDLHQHSLCAADGKTIDNVEDAHRMPKNCNRLIPLLLPGEHGNLRKGPFHRFCGRVPHGNLAQGVGQAEKCNGTFRCFPSTRAPNRERTECAKPEHFSYLLLVEVAARQVDLGDARQMTLGNLI